MSESFSVVVASSMKDQAYRVRSLLDRERDLEVTVKAIGNNGHADPLHGLGEMPELLILILGPGWESELDALSARAADGLPAILVIGQEGNPQQMRRAMKLGAKDFIGLAVESDELVRCVRQVAGESRRVAIPKATGPASLIAVLNSKGGSGASFVASSLSHAFAHDLKQNVALIDLDLQFGVQDLCQDLKPRTSLLSALGRVDQLDAVALEGCMGRHASGLRLLGEYDGALPLAWEVPQPSLERLLKLATASYDQVVIDLPRQIDPLTSTALTSATVVCLVMNQSLIHLRDTKRMLKILTSDLGIPRAHLRIVVNRYQADSTVNLRDIQSATEIEHLIQIPNDYRRASESMNLGVPLITKSPGAPITRSFADMATLMAGTSSKKKQTGLRSAIAGLFGQSGDR